MPLLPHAEPLHLANGPVGAVLLHGFTGQPYSVKPWAQYLAEHDLTVSVPRLPGHGTTWQEMNKTTWSDWYGEAERAFRHLRQTCETVFVMGLSMGGTLSLRLAEMHGSDVAGIVAVNPAVFTNRPDRHLLPILRRVMGGYPGVTNDIKKPHQDEYGYDRLPLNAASSFQDLWKYVRADIGKVESPLRIYTSREDHVIEPENSDWIMRRVSSPDREQVMLENSYHVATLDNDAEKIFSGSLDFVRRLVPGDR